jgi:hypothetical protein
VVAIGGEWARGAWISFVILVLVSATTLLGVAGFWTFPEQLFGDYVRQKKREKFDAEVARLNAHRALENFKVNLDKNRIEGSN